MATPQLSPGVLTREVDLTVGRAENILDNIGAIAGPFPIGPVDVPIDINTEQELIDIFGKPKNEDGQYEYWLSASSFLSYGGVLKVVRCAGSELNNANSGFNSADSTDLKIYNYDDYDDNHSDDSATFAYAAKNPGTWANGLKVCVIDDKADQTIGIATTNPFALGARIGYGVTVGINSVRAGTGSTNTFSGYIKGIVTGVTTDTADGNSTVDIKIVSTVSTEGVETQVTYSENDRLTSLVRLDNLTFVNNSGSNQSSISASSVADWYDQQTLGLINSTIYWKSIAPKPITNGYSVDRNSKNDAIHIAIFDDEGKITGIQGNLLEKHLNLSKSSDSISAVNAPQKIFWKNYIANYSSYVFAGANPSDEYDAVRNVRPVATGFTTYSGNPATSFAPVSISDGIWNQETQGITFNAIGNVTYTLTSGNNYTAQNGYTVELGDLITSYGLFSNRDEIEVDFVINGPGFSTLEESQAKANYLISLANTRKDCIACISPHRGADGKGIVGLTNSDTQTDNIVRFFSSLPSSSYAVFDTGYKYMYDRFNNQFRYVPCNGDVAGMMVRTNLVAYPWYSPAGQQRGVLNNAIKLAYNPNKAQRDQLYPRRINAIVNQPGIGILLFGDKTALGYASAFDRINVRRLFLTVEQALQKAAEAQLFELNDQITRANFVNIVEPYLRDIQAKRGVYDFLVICDETNNTPDIIDNNEFRADIFLKPAKSINFVTLTFVATRTGVSFEEVAGRV
jgi:hypothetical protein